MTRDEAIAKIRETDLFDSNAMEVDQFVGRLVAMGLLKLDEPKTALDKAYAALDSYEYSVNGRLSVTATMQCLKDAGLKIVEENQ